MAWGTQDVKFSRHTIWTDREAGGSAHGDGKILLDAPGYHALPGQERQDRQGVGLGDLEASLELTESLT